MASVSRHDDSAAHQSVIELAVFESFARMCPLAIDPTSIAKRDPPSPDIHCKLRDGTAIAFELVEVIDPSLAHRTNRQVELRAHYEERYEALSAADRQRIDAVLANALVGLWFRDDATERSRKNVAIHVLATLAGITSEFEGDLDASDLGDRTSSVVHRVSIKRGDFCGPCFDVSSAGSFADAAIEAVRSKFAKAYQSAAPIHLVAYYHMQPEPRARELPEELCAFINDNLDASPFVRVWLYFQQSERVLALPRDEAA